MYQITECQNTKAYLAVEGLENQLLQELPGEKEIFGRLVWVKQELQNPVFWFTNEWQKNYQIEFDSISACAKALSSMQRNWWPYFSAHARRGTLIQESLPYISPKPLVFPAAMQTTYPPLGSWTLLNANTALASPVCSSSRPNGEWNFVEDRIGPPSRAYLKLWEVFSRMQMCPKPKEKCLDLGASPGGWTWVLTQAGARVVAIDRSPLREDLMASSLVQFKNENAFSVNLQDYPDASWLFCDVICYPEKLYEFFVTKVLPSSIQNAVCTIKFQGSEHYGVITKFAEIPGGSLVHLTHNKHELTFVFRRMAVILSALPNFSAPF